MLRDALEQLRRSDTGSVEIVRSGLQAADADPAQSTFTCRFDQQALELANAADLTRRAGIKRPYPGIPVTVKDNFDIAGMATTAGSKLLAGAAPAEEDAEVVNRLRSAGFIVVGRTNMSEFAFTGLGVNPHFGSPRNPAFPREQRITGGSSSGAAISVALNIVPAAIGTDTGGSVRIPAALCGLVGFKPTASAISNRGILPLSHTLDAVGVIANSVECCASIFQVLRNSPGLALDSPASPHLESRLALVENYVFDGIDSTVERAFRSAVERLEQAGARITRLVIPELDDIPRMHQQGTFPAAEAFAWHRDLIAESAAHYDQRVLKRIRSGGEMSASDYIRLCERRKHLAQALSKRTRFFDALLMPTVPIVAPSLAALADESTYYSNNALLLRNPSIANLMDGCAISLPCQRRGEAPVGLSLVTVNGNDDGLLRLAGAVETVLRG